MTYPSLVDLPYRAGSAIHRAAYRAGLLRRAALEGFTVAVGSLHFGGAGKTPVAMHLARPGSAILSRGYGGRLGGQPRVLLGEQDSGPPWSRQVSGGDERRTARDWSAEVGDEAALVAASLPGVPVGVGPDRVASAAAVSAVRPEIRRFVLDDGFSHHRLERDLDVLVLPVEVRGDEARIARGLLREGPASASRAHALVLVNDGAHPFTAAQIDQVTRRIGWAGLLAVCRKVPGPLWSVGDGQEVSNEAVRGRDVAVVCALGQPGSLLRSVSEQLGARVRETLTRRDHHRFQHAELADAERLARRSAAEFVLTSLKDAVRMPREFDPALPWLAVGMTLEWERGEDELLSAVEGG